jgi:cystine transport system ATP-binding protein
MIEIAGLKKRFGAVTVLDGVDHQQAAGEVVALIGPSGCGKSTLLRCLNWLETPDAGSLRLGDVRIEAGTPEASDRRLRQRLRRRTGMIFQQFHLFPHRTALENVMEAPVHVDRLPLSEARALAMGLLSKVGLADRAHHLPSQLSGGQQQRVAIARALAMNPQILGWCSSKAVGWWSQGRPGRCWINPSIHAFRSSSGNIDLRPVKNLGDGRWWQKQPTPSRPTRQLH